MRFLIDENIRRDVALWLKAQGHDIILISKGQSDQNFAKISQRQKRVILTHDADFALTLQFPPEKFHGIIILRIHPITNVHCVASLGFFLGNVTFKQIKGKTFVIDNESYIELD